MKTILLKDIIAFIGTDLLKIIGDYSNLSIKHLKDASEIDEWTLDWVNLIKDNGQIIAEESKAKALIVTDKVVFSDSIRNQRKVLIYVKNPKLAIAKIANQFFTQKYSTSIHPTAIIDPQAEIGDNVYIGPNCIIEKCIVGNNVQLHGNNYIYADSMIGDNVEIHAGAVIGSVAHNFITDNDGNMVEFPHLGNVNLENDVVVGANSIVARGVLSSTIIGKGTKIAQHVMVGANNKIGNNCAIRPGVKLAGSVMVKDNVIIGLAAIVREQLVLEVNSTIGMGAVVTKSVPPSETWIGNPARRLK